MGTKLRTFLQIHNSGKPPFFLAKGVSVGNEKSHEPVKRVVYRGQGLFDVEDMVEAAEAEDVFNVFVEVAYGDGAAVEFAVLLELHEEAET